MAFSSQIFVGGLAVCEIGKLAILNSALRRAEDGVQNLGRIPFSTASLLCIRQVDLQVDGSCGEHNTNLDLYRFAYFHRMLQFNRSHAVDR